MHVPEELLDHDHLYLARFGHTYFRSFVRVPAIPRMQQQHGRLSQHKPSGRGREGETDGGRQAGEVGW